MGGLFSTLGIGSLGITAQQSALNVTSHNIANASTDGYTRQRVDLQSLSFNMGVNRPSGMGVTVDDITRIRDSFIDFQVRNATSAQGTSQAINNYLGQLQDVINEPSSTGISTLISNFYSSWATLSGSPNNLNAQTKVVNDTKTLTDALNSTYSKLQDLKTNCHTKLDSQITDINATLDKIDSLNDEIMKTKALGIEPNDLMDKRDSLLDSLSAYMKINVDNKQLDGVNVTVSDGDQLSGTTLIQTQDEDTEKRLSYISNINLVSGSGSSAVYDITYYKNGDMTTDKNKVDVYVTGLSNDQLQDMEQNRVVWANRDGMAIGLSEDINGNPVTGGTSAATAINVSTTPSTINLFKTSDGSVQGTMTVQTDIDKYTDDLNKLAKAVAFSVNAIESGDTSGSTDTKPFFVNSDAAGYTVNSDGKNILTTYNTSTDEAGITAGNITINKEIFDIPTEIKSATKYDGSGTNTSGNTDGNRALAISQLKNTTLNIQDVTTTTTRADFFDSTKLNQGFSADSNGVNTVQNYKGGSTMDDYFTTVVDQVATEVSKASTTLVNQKAQLQSLQQSRDSVSGVSLDEEMTNLLQYNHAYQANAKVITTVGELLDVIIGLIK